MAAATHLPFAPARVRRDREARRRRRYADGLEQAVLAARTRRAPGTFTSAIPVQRHAVLDERALLLELACRVREAAGAPRSALDPVRRLLTDGAGPLYSPCEPGALREAALAALRALDNGGPEPE